MTVLYAWAARWGIPMAAIADLQNLMEPAPAVQATREYGTEAGVATIVRLEAAKKRVLLWRNNVGAFQNIEGQWIRFGLANDSAAVNKRIKSADFIGVKPVTVTPAMVGHVVGLFISREVKAPGWSYSGTEREQAQMRWAQLVTAFGGDACFATGAGTL